MGQHDGYSIEMSEDPVWCLSEEQWCYGIVICFCVFFSVRSYDSANYYTERPTRVCLDILLLRVPLSATEGRYPR